MIEQEVRKLREQVAELQSQHGAHHDHCGKCDQEFSDIKLRLDLIEEQLNKLLPLDPIPHVETPVAPVEADV